MAGRNRRRMPQNGEMHFAAFPFVKDII